MLPSLFREASEKGRSKASFVSMFVAMALIFALLISLQLFSVEITPNFGWYIFCGFCLALSVIAPGMSFSTLLMPLGLYEPFVAGIGNFDFAILIPAGIGALEDDAYFRDNCRTIMENRRFTADALKTLGFTMPDSMTNFVFAKHPGIPGQTLYEKLKARGILVRHFSSPKLTDYNRITIGSKQQMEALIGAITDILEETV